MGMGGVRLRFIRLTRIDARVEAAVYVWWHGQPGPNDSPESSVRRCTDQYELRAEVFTRGSSGPLGFRAYELCNPIASEFRVLFDELVPSLNPGVRRRE